MKEKYDYLIVGAGLAGATFAAIQKKRNKKCLVIDKRKNVGGNIYTKKMAGIDVHWYGAHIFHTSNKMVWDFVNQFAEFDPFINSPIANYKNQLFSLPFNMYTFNQLWGITKPKQAHKIIERQIRESGIDEPTNLEEQAIKMVGTDIYQMFIEGYTEKQWGRKCSELSPDIIKRIPVRYIYNNNYFNDKYQGIPHDGYTHMIGNMLDGIEVRLGVNFDNELLNSIEYGKIIYTGMIDEYYDYCLGHLNYRSLKFKHVVLKQPNYQGNAVVNYTDKDVPYTRIIEHKHFKEYDNSNVTVISREFPNVYTGRNIPFYPVNSEEDQKLYNQYKEKAANEKDIIFCGRLGTYKYLNMDQVIEQIFDLLKVKEI